MFIVGIDVGGTFTDLTAVDEATGPRRRHQGAVAAAPRGGRRARGTGCARHRRARRAAARARHHRRHQRRAGAPGRARGRAHDGRVPRPDRDRPHQAQHSRAVRADVRAPQARRRAQAPFRGRRAARRRRLRAGAARSGQRRARARRGRWPPGAEAIAVCLLHAYLESGPRAHDRRHRQGPLPRRAGVVLGRRRRRVPRVRALLDDGAQRLPAAAHGRLPGRARGASARDGLRARRPHRRLQRRHDDDGDGAPAADQDDLLRARPAA